MLLGNLSNRPGHSLFLTDTAVFMTSLKCILVRINLTGQAVLLACSQRRYGLAELRGYLHPGSALPVVDEEWRVTEGKWVPSHTAYLCRDEGESRPSNSQLVATMPQVL